MRQQSFPLLGAVAALLLVSLLGVEAQAGDVYDNYQGITRVRKGVINLGVDSLLLVRNTTTPLMVNGEEAGDVSDSTLSLTVGPGLRYFLKDNLAVGAQAHFFLENNSNTISPEGGEETESSTSDTGGIFFATAHYYLRLGSSFFLAPGLGAGGFVGTRGIPDPTDDAKTINSSLSGVAFKGHLGCVFYANQHWNLRAGADIVYRLGSITPEASDDSEDPASQSFTTLDAAFTIGMGYSF